MNSWLIINNKSININIKQFIYTCLTQIKNSDCVEEITNNNIIIDFQNFYFESI